MWKWLLGISEKKQKKNGASAENKGPQIDGVRILKHAQAMRVVFFYPGEEGTYVDDCTVTLFENGVVHLRSKTEETTTHLHHCEILWRFETPADKGKAEGKVRVLKFKNREGKIDSRTEATPDVSNPTPRAPEDSRPDPSPAN